MKAINYESFKLEKKNTKSVNNNKHNFNNKH